MIYDLIEYKGRLMAGILLSSLIENIMKEEEEAGGPSMDFKKKHGKALSHLLLAAAYAGDSIYDVEGMAQHDIGVMMAEGKVIDPDEESEDEEPPHEEEGPQVLTD